MMNQNKAQMLQTILEDPSKMISDNAKLLEVARFISTALKKDATQTTDIDTLVAQEKAQISSSTSKKAKTTGSSSINSNFVCKKKIFVEQKLDITKALVEGKIIYYILGDIKVYENIISKEIIANKVNIQSLFASVLYNQNGGIIIHGDVAVGKFQNKDESSFLIKGIKQWLMVKHDDFQNGHQDWHHGTQNISMSNNCGDNDQFLGGHCKLASQEVSKTFNNLPVHQHIRIQATFHMFDNWQGEQAYMKLNDKIVWKKRGLSQKGDHQDLCGNSQYDDPNMNIKIDKVFSNQDSSFTLSFGSDLNDNPCDASYAIDNIIIYTK